jgi:hypothetical protein
MSGAFPTSIVPKSVKITSMQTTLVSTSISGRRQARQLQNQKWKLRATFPPLTRAQFNEVFAFVVKQRGRKENFTFTPPIFDDAVGTETGSILTTRAHVVAESTIFMDGFASDGAGRFKAGDFIKFASHDKVYMIVSDVTSSSNAAEVTIEPPLTTALGNNEAATYDAVPFTVALTNDIQEIQLQNTGFFQYEIDMIEVI